MLLSQDRGILLAGIAQFADGVSTPWCSTTWNTISKNIEAVFDWCGLTL
jgi:hypothetical protein